MTTSLHERLRTSASTLLLLATAGCGPFLHLGPDPSFVKPVAREYRAAAVLPFGGDPALRRVAEESAALGLREQVRVPVTPPFRVGRVLDRAAGDGTVAADWREALDAWLLTVGKGSAAEGSARPVPDAVATLRALGTALGADVLIAGTVRRLDPTHFGEGPWMFPGSEVAVSTLVLVDVHSGDTTALVRSLGHSTWNLGVHESSAEAARRGAAVLRAYLATPPGNLPTGAVPRRSTAPTGDMP